MLGQCHMCPKYYLYMMQMCYSARIFYGLGQGVSGMGRWRLQADNFWKAHCFINSLRLGSTFSPPFSLESWWCFPLFAGQYCLLKKTPKIFGFFSKNFLSSKIRLSEKPGQTYRYCKRYSDD